MGKSGMQNNGGNKEQGSKEKKDIPEEYLFPDRPLFNVWQLCQPSRNAHDASMYQKKQDQRRRKRRGDKPGPHNGKKNSCSLQCIATYREDKLFFINGVVVPLGMIKAMGG
jgi:hypothetical protein